MILQEEIDEGEADTAAVPWLQMQIIADSVQGGSGLGKSAMFGVLRGAPRSSAYGRRTAAGR